MVFRGAYIFFLDEVVFRNHPINIQLGPWSEATLEIDFLSRNKLTVYTFSGVVNVNQPPLEILLCQFLLKMGKFL